MPALRRLAVTTALAAALCPASLHAQAFTPPRGLLAVTLAYQLVHNTGHRLDDGTVITGDRLDDGTVIPSGQSVSTGFLLEGEYGLSDRLALSLGIPYLFARYTGEGETPWVYRPVDSCRCWHSSFQDFSILARYRLGGPSFAVTPSAGVVLPSHDYEYKGEAVVGRNLNEAHLGFAVGVAPPRGPLAGFDVQATYTYAFVERVLGIPNDRSLGSVSVGYVPARRLHVGATANWQVTHGGLRVPDEVDTPEKIDQHDRILRDDYWRVGGSVAYSFERFDVFASVSVYVGGRNTHTGQAYTVGVSAYFGGPFRW